MHNGSGTHGRKYFRKRYIPKPIQHEPQLNRHGLPVDRTNSKYQTSNTQQNREDELEKELLRRKSLGVE